MFIEIEQPRVKHAESVKVQWTSKPFFRGLLFKKQTNKSLVNTN